MPENEDSQVVDRVENLLGAVLCASVFVSAAIVLLGGVIYLFKYSGQPFDYRSFHNEPADLKNLAGIVKAAVSLRVHGLIQFGILILIATPVARVVFSILSFALQRDRAYVILTLIVLGVLIYSLTGGAI